MNTKTKAKEDNTSATAVSAAVIKLGLDVHARQITVCRQLDDSTPQAAATIAGRMPALEKIDAQKSFFSQRPWCGLRITIRTRQPNVPPLDQLSVGNPASVAHIQGAAFATNRISRATRSGYVV